MDFVCNKTITQLLAFFQGLIMQRSPIEGLLIEKRESLKRLLDLYLSGEFHKEMLIEKKTDLERIIAELEKERAGLIASMEA